MTLDLVKTGDGWRIAEIKAPSGSLKELFKVKSRDSRARLFLAIIANPSEGDALRCSS